MTTEMKRALLSGKTITAHNTTSGQYQNLENPSGWLHATFRVEGRTFYMRGMFGSTDWAFASLWRGDIVIHTSLSGHYRKVSDHNRERVRTAGHVARYMLGKAKRLPENVKVKAPARCALCAANGRVGRLTAGQSLTLQDGPCGVAFYGPVCGGRTPKKTVAWRNGLDRMSQLIAEGKKKGGE